MDRRDLVPRTHAAPGRLLLGLLLLLLVVSACRQAPGDESGDTFEVVDVQPRLEVETAEDPQAVERPDQLAGVLPGDFPPDLAIHLPASLVDFGDAAGGWRSASLLTTDGRDQVESSLRQSLRGEGWQITSPSGDTWELRKSGRQARLRLSDDSAGTLYRYEYPLR